MEYIKTFENYKKTSWEVNIDGKNIVVTIDEIEDYLKNTPIIEIPVDEIKNLSIHKDKKDKKTLKRIEDCDLKYPIIISKNPKGEYNKILDGNHRLQKAINNNITNIKSKVLDLKKSPEKYKKLFNR